MVELLAAAEAAERVCAETSLKITRVAGTSAGALAAACLAHPTEKVVALRERLRSHEQALQALASLKLLRPVPLLKLFLGYPIVSSRRLRRVLEPLFDALDVVKLSEFTKTQVLFTATDLRNGELRYRETSSAEPSVTEALLDSCGLPFLIRGARTFGDEHAMVDGGICDNLPVDKLLEEQAEYGDVVAFSFPRRSRTVPRSSAALAGSLLSVAIENSSVRSRARVEAFGGEVIELPGLLDTLDFERAFTFLFDGEPLSLENRSFSYISLVSFIQEELQAAMERFVQRRSANTLAPRPGKVVGAEVPWLYERFFRDEDVRVTEVNMIAVLHSLEGCEVDGSAADAEARWDETLYEFRLTAGTGTVRAFRVSLSFVSELLFRDWRLEGLEVRDEKGRAVEARVAGRGALAGDPAANSAADSDAGVVVFFERPLPPGESRSYKVRLHIVGRRASGGEASKVRVGFSHERERPVGTVRLMVWVPKSLEVEILKPPASVSFQVMAGDECRQVHRPAGGLTPVGVCSVSAVAAGETLSLVLIGGEPSTSAGT